MEHTLILEEHLIFNDLKLKSFLQILCRIGMNTFKMINDASGTHVLQNPTDSTELDSSSSLPPSEENDPITFTQPTGQSVTHHIQSSLPVFHHAALTPTFPVAVLMSLA